MEVVVVSLGLLVFLAVGARALLGSLSAMPSKHLAVEGVPKPTVWVAFDAPGLAHKAYLEGDGDRVITLLGQAELNSVVALNTAVGRYAEALSAAVAAVPSVFGRPEALDAETYLLRLNVAEALSELGRLDEALALLEPTAAVHQGPWEGLLESGRRITRAWILTSLGRTAEARATLVEVVPSALGADYEAEAYLTLARLCVREGAVGPAGQGLQDARSTARRPSSLRNLLFLEASWWRLQGKLEDARRLGREGATHRWRWQGGEGLLALGDDCLALGDAEEATRAWRQCLTQDPQSLAARGATERLATLVETTPTHPLPQRD